MSDIEPKVDMEIELGSEEDTRAGESRNATVPAYALSDIFPNEEKRNAFVEWISSEIIDVRDGGEREERAELWKKYRKMRRAKRTSSQRSTPWTDSASIESSLGAQKVNTIYGKEVAAFAIKKPPVRVRAANPDDSDKAESLEKFFKYQSENRYGMNMPVVQNSLFYDQVSLGCAIAKVPFQIDEWAFKRTDAQSGTMQVNYVRHRGPAVIPIRAEDFFTRPYWKDLQRAPWIAVRYRIFRHELEQKMAQQLFDESVMELLEPAAQVDDARDEALANSGTNAASYNQNTLQQEFEIYEVNAFFDVDDDGYSEDVIAWIEPETKTILRSEFNPLSIRDVEMIPYLEDPESLYPVGVLDLVADLQEEHTSIKRMRLDGTKLAMLKVMISLTGSGIDPDETIAPLKHFQVDDLNSIKVLDFPDIAPSCLAAEELCKQEADRVTGASDYMAGFQDTTVKSGASVGGMALSLQQNNGILNSILAAAQRSIGNIYMIALYQCMANRDQVDLSWMNEDDRINMMEILSLQVEDIPTKFNFVVETTDISQTDEARRQNVLGATQLYSMYGQQIMQLAQMSPDLQAMLPEIALKLAVGGTDLIAHGMATMDIPNTDDVMPFLDHVAVKLKAADAIRAQQAREERRTLDEARQSGGFGAGATGSSFGVGTAGGQPGAPGSAGQAGPEAAMAQGAPGGAV